MRVVAVVLAPVLLFPVDAVPPSANPYWARSSGVRSSTRRGCGLDGVKNVCSAPPDLYISSSDWYDNSRTPGTNWPLSSYLYSSSLYVGMSGRVASDTEPSTPMPANIGAFLASIFGAPAKPCLVACPNLLKKLPVKFAPPPYTAVGAAGAAAATVGATGAATVGAAGAAATACACASMSGEVMALFRVAPRVPACAPAPAACSPNFCANCFANSGLLIYAPIAGLAAAPRPMLEPNRPALSLSNPPAFPPRIEPPAPTAPAIPAPPKALRPAMRPLLRSPVSRVEPAPTIPAARGAPTPVAARPKPISVGSSLLRKPASGRPVCGLTESDPPFAIAKP